MESTREEEHPLQEQHLSFLHLHKSRELSGRLVRLSARSTRSSCCNPQRLEIVGEHDLRELCEVFHSLRRAGRLGVVQWGASLPIFRLEDEISLEIHLERERD